MKVIEQDRPRAQVVDVRVERRRSAGLMRRVEDAAEQVDRHRAAGRIEHRGRRREAAHAAARGTARLVEVGLHEVRSALADDGVRFDGRRVTGGIGEHEDPFGEEAAVVLAEQAHDFLDRRALGHRLVDQISVESRQAALLDLHGRGGEAVEPQAALVHPPLGIEVVEADVHPSVRAGGGGDEPELRARVGPVLVVADQHLVFGDRAERRAGLCHALGDGDRGADRNAGGEANERRLPHGRSSSRLTRQAEDW